MSGSLALQSVTTFQEFYEEIPGRPFLRIEYCAKLQSSATNFRNRTLALVHVLVPLFLRIRFIRSRLCNPRGENTRKPAGESIAHYPGSGTIDTTVRRCP